MTAPQAYYSVLAFETKMPFSNELELIVLDNEGQAGRVKIATEMKKTVRFEFRIIPSITIRIVQYGGNAYQYIEHLDLQNLQYANQFEISKLAAVPFKL